MDVTPNSGKGIDAPPPHEAYTNAPDPRREMHQALALGAERDGHQARPLTRPPTDATAAERAWLLRRTALMDRMALDDPGPGPAAETAEQLLRHDRRHPDLAAGPHHSDTITLAWPAQMSHVHDRQLPQPTTSDKEPQNMGVKQKTLAILAGTVLAAGLTSPAFGSTTAHSPALRTVATGSGMSVVEWNRELITILGDPKAQPSTVQPTRSFALLQAAEYDAVVSITRAGPAYVFSVSAPGGARADAAADQAAHDVLVALYPAKRAGVDQRLSSQLSAIPGGPGKQAGIGVGAAVARRLISLRSNDGSSAEPPRFRPGNKAGDYRPTPPKFPAPVFTNWGSVKPFVLASGRQFRPAPPPAVSGAAYATALNEVKSLGSKTSTTRTPDQTAAAKFWAAAPVWNVWNQVAQGLVTSQNASLEKAVKVFARLDLSLADTTIAMYDAKYAYRVWRPVTAIRLGGTHHNPSIVGDPNWTPLLPTAPDPSYPGAHGALSQAAATTLAGFYGARHHLAVTSKGATRTFAGFQDAATEAWLSRIWSGQHTSLDNRAGQQLGTQVADFVARHL
ncbi:vanadium-dependent haloperoxidase [Streptomyces mirabilis]|uniref:vanadium-dependent haloperoxidase n=1 Tax=Streptomyces mirabilis TaxID=68239 RepID=UPI00364B3E00